MRTSTDDPADTHVSAGSRVVRGGPMGRARWSRYAAVPVGVLLAVLVRATLVETFFVPDEGMSPTLAAGDRVLVTKVGTALSRGSVVLVDISDAFDGPSRATHEAEGFPGSVLSGLADALGVRNGARAIVARVVATGGDRVTCSPDGRVVVGVAPVSPALGCEGVDVSVPEGSIWVLGDDPARAVDSLAQVDSGGTGLIAERDVVGSVVLRWWPVTRAGIVRSLDDAR